MYNHTLQLDSLQHKLYGNVAKNKFLFLIPLKFGERVFGIVPDRGKPSWTPISNNTTYSYQNRQRTLQEQNRILKFWSKALALILDLKTKNSDRNMNSVTSDIVKKLLF